MECQAMMHPHARSSHMGSYAFSVWVGRRHMHSEAFSKPTILLLKSGKPP